MASDVVVAGLQAQVNALQQQVDSMDERLGAITENINLLRGDAQRVEAARRPPGRPRKQAIEEGADA